MELKFTMYQHKKQKEKKIILEAENLLMKYKAKNTSPENIAKNQVSDFMVGIWDKEHHKIRLIEVEQCLSFTQVSKHAKKYAPVKENMFQDVEYYEQKSQLVNAFGTKKNQMILRNNNVEDDTINTEKQMNKILKHDVLKLIKEEEKHDSDEDYDYYREVLPAHDPNEVNIELVYSKNSIIPKQLHEFIQFKELHKSLKDPNVRFYVLLLIRKNYQQIFTINMKI